MAQSKFTPHNESRHNWHTCTPGILGYTLDTLVLVPEATCTLNDWLSDIWHKQYRCIVCKSYTIGLYGNSLLHCRAQNDSAPRSSRSTSLPSCTSHLDRLRGVCSALWRLLCLERTACIIRKHTVLSFAKSGSKHLNSLRPPVRKYTRVASFSYRQCFYI